MSTPTGTPLPATIDYTSKDFAGLESSLFAYASLVMPQWTARQVGDFGVLLVDCVAYVGDILSYYQDRIAAEAFLSTATQYSSVVKLAALIGYTPASALPATGTVTLVSDPSTTSDIVLPAATQLITEYQAAIDGVVTFELDDALTVPPAGGTATGTVTQGKDQGTYTLAVSIGVPATTQFLVKDLGQSTGAAGAEFTVPTAPVLLDTLVVIVQLPAGPAVWSPVATLLTAGPTDTVYSLSTDATGTVTITFGDSVNGAIVPAGVTISASWRVGGGAYGNLPAGSIVDLAVTQPGVSVQSSSQTTGGADAESINSIRTNAPRAWRFQQRCVTVADTADAALATLAVYKASAILSGPGAATVFIVAAGNTAPTTSLITTVQNYLTPLMMAGCTVSVQGGTVVPVNVGTDASPVTLGVQPTYNRANTLAAVQQAISNLFAPDAVDFGQLMPLSAVYAAIDAVPGVALVSIPVYARSDLPQTGTADAFFRPWEIPSAGTVVITATGGM